MMIVRLFLLLLIQSVRLRGALRLVNLCDEKGLDIHAFKVLLGLDMLAKTTSKATSWEILIGEVRRR